MNTLGLKRILSLMGPCTLLHDVSGEHQMKPPSLPDAILLLQRVDRARAFLFSFFLFFLAMSMHYAL